MAAAIPISQLEHLWNQAGGDPRYANVMARIAYRESRGEPGAKNLVGRDHSIGLWQINQLAHHGRYGSDVQLTDPRTNARAAVALFNESKKTPGGPLKPWSLGSREADRTFLLGSATTGQVDKDGGGVLGAALGVGVGGVLGPVGAIAGGIAGAGELGADALDTAEDIVTGPFDAMKAIAEAVADIAKFMAKAAAWLTDPGSWLRVLKFVGGIVIGVLAFKQLSIAASG